MQAAWLLFRKIIENLKMQKFFNLPTLTYRPDPNCAKSIKCGINPIGEQSDKHQDQKLSATFNSNNSSKVSSIKVHSEIIN